MPPRKPTKVSAKPCAAPTKTINKKPPASSSKAAPSGLHFLLAHAAGHHPAGCQHATMQKWATALRQYGTVHDTLVYPKPFNIMPRLVAAHAEALGKAGAAVVLVGVGMGARVAVHLLAGTPGDDGKPLPAVPAAAKARIKAAVAIDYPLLRVGTREVRSAPLLALPSDAPPLLLVTAPGDKHADAAKLGAVCKGMRAQTTLLQLGSGSSECPSVADVALVASRAVALAG